MKRIIEKHLKSQKIGVKHTPHGVKMMIQPCWIFREYGQYLNLLIFLVEQNIRLFLDWKN